MRAADIKLQNGAQTDLGDQRRVDSRDQSGLPTHRQNMEKQEVNEVKSCTCDNPQIQEGLELSQAHWQLNSRDDTDSDAPGK